MCQIGPKTDYRRYDFGIKRVNSGNSDHHHHHHHHQTSVSLFFLFFFFGCVGSSLRCAGCSLWYVRVSSGILIVVCQLSCLTHVGSWFPDQGSNLHPCTGRWVLSYWTTREGPPLVSLRHPGKREWIEILQHWCKKTLQLPTRPSGQQNLLSIKKQLQKEPGELNFNFAFSEVVEGPQVGGGQATYSINHMVKRKIHIKEPKIALGSEIQEVYWWGGK